MPVQLDIANQALAHLAIGQPIAAMDDGSQQAQVMTQFYAQTVSEVFRAFSWPFATKFATLAPVAGPSPRASTDWTYSYRYPADAVYVRRLRIQPRRPDLRFARVPFLVARDGTGLLILTDAPPIAATTDFNAFPEAEYTVSVPEAQWPFDFASAVAHLLAWYAAPTLTPGDPSKLGIRAYQEYDRLVRSAWQSSLNEREEDIVDPECAFLTARD